MLCAVSVSDTRKKLSHAKIVGKPRNRCYREIPACHDPNFELHSNHKKTQWTCFARLSLYRPLDALHRSCERHTQKTQPYQDRWKTKKPIGRSLHAMIRILSCTQTTKKRSRGVSPDFPSRCFAPCLSVPHAKNPAPQRSLENPETDTNRAKIACHDPN